MKVTKTGLDYLIKNIGEVYTVKQDEEGTKDYTFESILNFVMNEQKLITLDPETDMDNLQYIADSIYNNI